MTVAGTLLIGCLLALPPVDKLAITDQVDLVEVNHYYDLDRNPPRCTSTQIIFWDWDDELREHVVVSFRVLKLDGQYPQKDHIRGDYVSLWNDRGRFRLVRAKSFRETWTGTDPECDNLLICRRHLRRGLQGEGFLLDRVGEMFLHLLE